MSILLSSCFNFLNHASPALQDIPRSEDTPPVEVLAQLGIPSSHAGLRITAKNKLIFTPRAIYESSGQYYELNTMYRIKLGKLNRQHLFLGAGLGYGWHGRQFGMTYLVDKDVEPYYYQRKSRRGYFQANYIFDFNKFRLQAAAQLARYKHSRYTGLDHLTSPCYVTGNELPSGWLYSFTLASEYNLGTQNTLSFLITGNLNYYDDCVHAAHSPVQLGVQIAHRFRRYK
ncbi:MAG: hypothetical protein ACPGED_02005 [Flavobacteriales bacterium]